MNLDDVFPHCDCFEQYRSTQPLKTRFHGDVQDKSCDGWKRLVDLVEVAAADGREEFSPGREIPTEEWRQVITLPASIARLKAVRRLVLYGSWLVRIPPEIGEMEHLERFEPYTSHRLHWFPYEITRCHRLTESVVSTRSLYGNFKHRPPFPGLQPARPSSAGLDLDHLDPAVWGVDTVTACSVCGRSLKTAGLHQAWISVSVATDVLPLLVNACSATCVRQIPLGAAGYLRTPHRGGPTVLQPPPER
jgi:hypothetical protein